MGRGVQIYLKTNSIDFADKEGGGKKIPKYFVRHIWKCPSAFFSVTFSAGEFRNGNRREAQNAAVTLNCTVTYALEKKNSFMVNSVRTCHVNYETLDAQKVSS